MNYQSAVLEFQQACDVQLEPTQKMIQLCHKLISEETAEALQVLQEYEFYKGIDQKAELAGELVDLIYVVCYCANVVGIPLDQVFAFVHRANMNKVNPETGKVNKREDGKVLKPDGWKPAPLKELFALQQACIDAKL